MSKNSKDPTAKNLSAREVKCPRCGNAALFSPENPFRPFCSERCKLIDLGAWAEETYAIPISQTEIDEEQNTDVEDDEEGFSGDSSLH